jgi:hypothetical protein
MYHPADDPDAEYVELVNIGAETINLNMVRFTRGIRYTFPSFELPPGDYCLIVRDLASFEARYGSHLPVVGQYDGKLDNAGEWLELVDALGQVIHSFRYRDDWYKQTDGRGHSLTVVDPFTVDPDALGDKSSWRPSTHPHGSPGHAD